MSHLIFKSVVCGSWLAILICLSSDVAAQGKQAVTNEKAEKGSVQRDGTANAAGDWVVVKPTGARALVEMPKKPRYVEKSFTPVKGQPPIKVKLHIATTMKGKRSFVFSYSDLEKAPIGKKKIRETLEGALRGSLLTVSGQLDDQPEFEMRNKTPGCQFVYSFHEVRKDKTVRSYQVASRIFLKGRRKYQLSIIMQGSAIDAFVVSKFLGSFTLVKPKSDRPPRPRVPQDL